ncbi:histidinol dehydrogenase [Legionella sp. km772]|uniref:histidinol dehydrogenase n=1 Tax=Legionella sp. km772 TaxID=2498111 RepID=UPI000F8EF47B|nr:histidinol dehydrogenase [Legionella sp. km772]RUR13049.1 hypothetical protein ELY15_03290 [Legionella sp. km772]
MLFIINWQSLSALEQKECLYRPVQKSSIKKAVLDIIKQVKTQGDKALFTLTKEFDQCTLKKLQVAPDKIKKASINSYSLAAIEQAIKTIAYYHKAAIPEENTLNTAPGISITTRYKPIQRVGLYVPGGNNTPLVSSLLTHVTHGQF